MVTVFQCC